VPILTLILGLTLSGCSPNSGSVPADKTLAIPADVDSAEFLDRASQIRAMDLDTALHGLCLLLDGQGSGDFQARLDRLRQRGVVPRSWTVSAGQTLTKGHLAYMVYQACGVREKGAALTLLGPSRRLCLRELQYYGMMSEGGLSAPVTGMEYVAVLTRADGVRRTGKFPN